MESPGAVYIFGNHDLGFYKIGSSKQPNYRMRTYQAYVPFELTMFHFILCDDSKEAEKRIHGHLQPKRIRGEWFEIHRDKFAALTGILTFEHGTFFDRDGQAIDVFTPKEADLDSFLYPDRVEQRHRTLVDSRAEYVMAKERE